MVMLQFICRPKPEVKAQRQASMKAEIEKIKVRHSGSNQRMGANAVLRI
jgi:hypothetical protein